MATAVAADSSKASGSAQSAVRDDAPVLRCVMETRSSRLRRETRPSVLTLRHLLQPFAIGDPTPLASTARTCVGEQEVHVGVHGQEERLFVLPS